MPATSAPADATTRDPKCRFCAAPLRHRFVDLGMSPLCQTQIAPSQLNQVEPFYPLLVHVCERCYLVQLEEYVAPEIVFGSDYPYFSSYSDSWIAHAKRYVEHVQQDFGISSADFVVELASNDGYLLRHFVEKGIRCLGVEPAESVASSAIERGIPTVVAFFGTYTAKKLRSSHGSANLILGNNVLAHVPDLNDFVGGVKELLAADGFVTFEFPHLMKLIDFNQFDTIYHEHFSYFSFTTVRQVFAKHGLTIFDVQELPTHGGSIRIYASHSDSSKYAMHSRVAQLEQREIQAGYREIDTYRRFAPKVEETKRRLLKFLISAKEDGKRVAGYGAPGKGNTLLNYCGIRTDFLEYTVDRNPHKKGTYTPGTRIPIFDPAKIFETRPDFVLILPWNLTQEITTNLAGIREWGGRFVVPIPEVKVLD
jgi:C-methyltransferase C-terminal domain/Putative zinc binding domain/Methyltransferase domain